MRRWLIRKLFNFVYKVRPPEAVSYYKTKEAARAKVVHGKDGSLQMEIEGEKHPFPGFPRGHVLTGPLAKAKHKVKNRIFNEVFAELEEMTREMQYHMLPIEKCAPAVRELDRVLRLVEDAEVVDDMKARIALVRRILVFFLQEDDAYRMRMQWAAERINMKEMKLSKADKYYFRGKYFKVDHDVYDY